MKLLLKFNIIANKYFLNQQKMLFARGKSIRKDESASKFIEKNNSVNSSNISYDNNNTNNSENNDNNNNNNNTIEFDNSKYKYLL